MTQEEALTILKTGANVFLTGEPGAGKTHTINAYVDYLRAHEIEPAITASTGIAATHIGGLTIHSCSGIGIKPKLTRYDIDKIATNEHVVRRISKTQVLIIDEVSMLPPDTLTSVDMVCREIKQNNEPFGGMQVVFVGDFFQLPPIMKKEPVVNKNDPYNQDIFEDGAMPNQSVRFAYGSKAWEDARPIICYISEQHRQDDNTFLSVLSAIRKNEFNEDHMEHIVGRVVEREESKKHYPKLFSHNVDVDTVNTEMLGKIDSVSQVYKMKSLGNTTLVAILKKGCLSPETLYLKIGAEVMCTKNNAKDGYVNGTLGVVVGFDSINKYPIIQISNGRKITIEPAEWVVEENGKIKASISQIPLRLAWAITVHKSQGMSMDKAVMDLSSVFEYGQGYVALSRVRNLDGLYILGYNARAFQVHPEVLKKDIEFHALSDVAEEKFANLKKEEVQKMHDNFILVSGGVLISKNKKPSFAQSYEKKEKVPTTEVTLNLWKEGKDVYEIADERKLSAKTIWGHIEELIEDKKITYPDINRLITKEVKKMMPEVAKAFKKLDTDKLSPVFEHFDGKYSYDDIRVVRMLMNVA
jgi:ATP-dependent DNA helicase PIF1